MDGYRCNLCNDFAAETLRSVIKHMGKIHRFDPNFHVLCGVDGCARTFRNYYTFRNHIQSRHQAALSRRTIDDERNNQEENDHLDVLQWRADNDEVPFNLANEEEQMKKTSALCLLQFKEKGRVPQTVVDLFVKSNTEIVQNTVDLLKSSVKDNLSASGLDFEAIPGLKDLFDADSSIRNPFNGLGNERQQHKYYLDNLGLVEPQEVVLATYHKKVRRGNILVNRSKRDLAYYIPILESLQQLLDDDAILAEILHPHIRNDNKLSDFCDGDQYKVHPLFANDATALQILLFYDELEVCNPLGSRANIHKLGAFYYTLGNIRPEYRSQMNAIQLLGLANSKDIKTYGIEPILGKFIEDLRLLEQDDGYAFMTNGVLMKFRGTLAYCSGDNLGSQLLGGFKEGSRSHRPCRECMGTADEIKLQFHETEFVLRNKESYNTQCQRLPLAEHYSKTYGINKSSCLNQSRYFHVVGGLPTDAMHDVLEGVLQYGVKEALKVYIFQKKYFTLDELNNRIESFDFGYHNDANKPSPILRKKLLSQDNSLKQHANQMWCLAVYLPMLIGVCIPEDDEHWKLLCSLLQITRIIFSPLISRDQAAYLQYQIQSHHEQFKLLYPECSIIPKMHYMVHMPRIILELGPLVRSWCMRYEAKHHYFKRLAAVIGNFINLPYTLSKRHQEGLCYRLQYTGGEMRSFVEKGFETGPGQITNTGVIEYNELLFAEQPGLNQFIPVFKAKWVIINGTKYKVGAIIHIGYNSEELPKFWEIVKIYIVDRDCRNTKFIVSEKVTLQFDDHFQAFQVKPAVNPRIKIEYHRNFTSFIPLNSCKPFGMQGTNQYVCMRVEMVP